MPEPVAERPILMSGPMVRAILSGRKAQTRRVVRAPRSLARDGRKSCGPMLYDFARAWADPGFPTDEAGEVLPMERWSGGSDPAPSSAYREHYLHVPIAHPHDGWEADPRHDRQVRVYCPHGRRGDQLWVREVFARRADIDPIAERAKALHYLLYRADQESDDDLADEWHDYHPGWRPSIHMPRWAGRLTLEIAAVRVERLQEISAEDVIAEGIDPAHRCDCEACARASCLCPATASSLILEYAAVWDRINGRRHPWESNPWVWCISFKPLGGSG